jgi:hypothetical protein
MTPDDLKRAYGQLEAHELGARLRLYDWLLAEAAVRAACEPFADAMALGCISWPTVYAEALDVALHHHIDHALPMVTLH